MTAPDGWQKGSFRGVAFVTRENDTEGGRRGILHEFPQSDEPIWEDMGRRARRFTLACHIIGDAYPAGADALEAALDAAGAGTLIHPWRGSMQVGVDTYARHDSTSEGGYADFQISFCESGLPSVPPPATDTARQAQAVADQQATAAPIRFADRFSLVKATAFVEDATSTLLSAAATATALQGGLLGGAGPALRAFQTGLDQLGVGSGLIRDGLDLGLSIVGMVSTLSALGSGTAARASAFHALLDFGSDVPPVIGGTPARAQERSNQAEIIQIVNLAAATGLVRTLADTRFASYEGAVGARELAADRLDLLALRQADAGDDAGAAAYDALRRAMVADLTARGATLARLQIYVPPVSLPSLVLAHRLYNDPASVEARAQELVTRNRVRHPAFVPGGQPLQVLSAEDGNG